MSDIPHHQPRETRTLQFARAVVKYRAFVATFLILSTGFFFFPTVNAILRGFGVHLPGPIVRVDTSARAQWPDHPFIHAQDKFAKQFGTSSLVAIGVVVREGTIFSPETLQKISRITKKLDGQGYDSKTKEREALRDQLEDQGFSLAEISKQLDRRYPPYPVNHDQIRSVAHRSTRVVQIEPDGAITSDILMKREPKTQADADKLRGVVRPNPPYIYGRLVSSDEKGALITAGFVTDRLSNREIYQAVFNHVQNIKQEEEDEQHFIYISGDPVHTGWVLKHAYEIGVYVVLTVIVIFALLLGYFRRLHGVVIPFIAAIATVIWGTGFTGWTGITFDPLVLVIPMIITARAVSHTVQMAERFFEDFEILAPQYEDPNEAKREAATVAMAELIVPGTLGIITDVAGLLVILVTTIPQMQDLAKFGAFWVASILMTVEILHPVMICYMAPPKEYEHFLPKTMVRFARGVGWVTTHRIGKYVVATITITLFVSSTYLALFHSKIGQATPGSPLLWPDHEFNIATAQIAEKFGGVDSIVIYTNGDRPNASADPLPIRRMEEFERWMQQHTNLGASLSIAPIMKQFWRINHYGDPKWDFVPNEPGTVRTVIFQLKTNGPPGFLRPYMTDDSRDANIAFYYPDHKGETIHRAVLASKAFIKDSPMGEVILRLDQDQAQPGASFFDRQKLTDMWYYMLGPLLPTRHHTLTAQLRKNGSYERLTVNEVSKDGLPEWIADFRDQAVLDYEEEKDSTDEGEYFHWPEALADWDTGDVSQWWENEEIGIRAVAVNTNDLIVHDLKAVDSVPRYQPTNSWTRGVQFVMAGGIMGILAAINDEVERSHVANISLIFLVIFVLHSVTYQSIPSGFIILLQIATATLVSLAYMAVRGVGLNINTLPVQSVGVGIGVDYAIYIVDRIRQEVADTEDIDEAIRRAVRTTGMAVSFTATTIVGGIVLWGFSNLRFQAEMALLLTFLMILNMLGAITVVPSFYSILRPRVATALLTDEQRAALEHQKEREKKLGLLDD
jgi:predicted RND superfamily exporter protein